MLDLGLVRGMITVLTLLTFVGICWWAYRPSSRQRFEEDAWLPFEGAEAELVRSRDIEETDVEELS
jgi:cytochrome c oxidase cbb3-type subunit 4